MNSELILEQEELAMQICFVSRNITIPDAYMLK
jgi:hypothetical protein